MLEQIVRSLRAKGRANRAAYWKVIALVWLAMIGVATAVFVISGVVAVFAGKPPDDKANLPLLGLIGTIIFLGGIYLVWVSLAVAIRRLHDRNKSGWWILLFSILPIFLNLVARAGQTANSPPNGFSALLTLIALPLTVWGFVEIGCLRGTPGINRFGPDPLNPDATPEIFS